jgi:hypothetical protein
MATSRNFSTSNTYVVYYIEAIQNSQNIGSNTSNVTVRVWAKRTNTGYETWGTGTVYLKINGTQYTDSITKSETITSSPRKLIEKTVNITHGTNGAKTLSMEAKMSHNAPANSDWNSWSMTLTTIPRTSKPTLSASSVNYGSAVTIYTNRASGSFTHTLRWAWNGRTGTIASNVATSQSWTVPNSFMDYIPSSTSSWGTIYCDTYSGSTKIGTESITLTTNVPSGIVPSFTSVTHSENVSSVNTAVGRYVQGLSKLNLAITGAKGTYSSTIRSYSITFDGTTYNSSSAVSGYIKGSGTLTITGKITDSRGRTATKSTTVSVTGYSSPKVTTFTVERCNSSGVADPMGTYARVNRAGSWTDFGTAAENPVTIVIKSRESGTTTWTTKRTDTDTATGFSGAYTVGTFDITKTYDIQVEVKDKFKTTTSTKVLSTAMVTMSWGRYGIGIGKIYEEGNGVLDIGGKLTIGGNLWGSAGGGIDMGNSDIVKANGIYFNDIADNNGEGLLFLKDGKTEGSTNQADYWNLRVAGDGRMFLNSHAIAITEDNIIFENSGVYMHQDQKVDLPRDALAYPNGFILWWCRYVSGAANNADWNFTILPKHYASETGGGHWCSLVYSVSGSTASWCYKYIYLTRTQITGHARNDDTPQTNMVLRYVTYF